MYNKASGISLVFCSSDNDIVYKNNNIIVGTKNNKDYTKAILQLKHHLNCFAKEFQGKLVYFLFFTFKPEIDYDEILSISTLYKVPIFIYLFYQESVFGVDIFAENYEINLIKVKHIEKESEMKRYMESESKKSDSKMDEKFQNLQKEMTKRYDRIDKDIKKLEDSDKDQLKILKQILTILKPEMGEIDEEMEQENLTKKDVKKKRKRSITKKIKSRNE